MKYKCSPKIGYIVFPSHKNRYDYCIYHPAFICDIRLFNGKYKCKKWIGVQNRFYDIDIFDDKNVTYVTLTEFKELTLKLFDE